MFRLFPLVAAIVQLFLLICDSQLLNGDSNSCINIDDYFSEPVIMNLCKMIVPPLDGSKMKGDYGKIGIIGGSTEYSGAPFFSAISALKIGADLVYVITTESAASVIKQYSPDLIVYPLLHQKHKVKLNVLLKKFDTIVIGPGMGRDEDTLNLFYDLLLICKRLQKPIVIDADGLYAISENVTVLQAYPIPGAILTPNHHEAKRLKEAVNKMDNSNQWHKYWGVHVSVLIKGELDSFHSWVPTLQWQLIGGGSNRRAAGQGDILAGALGVFYAWAIDKQLCESSHRNASQLAHSIASYAAAVITRSSNRKAFAKHGRSMAASDMLSEIHEAFEYLFEGTNVSSVN